MVLVLHLPLVELVLPLAELFIEHTLILVVLLCPLLLLRTRWRCVWLRVLLNVGPRTRLVGSHIAMTGIVVVPHVPVLVVVVVVVHLISWLTDIHIVLLV